MQQGDAQADLYLRVSLEREGKTAIERQEADCRTWAFLHGPVVRRVHLDRGRSGYKDIRHAKRYLRGRGRWIGGQPPYGLRVDADSGRLEPDPETAAYARLIADEALAGKPLVTRRREAPWLSERESSPWKSSG